jgi:hypothetical protein
VFGEYIYTSQDYGQTLYQRVSSGSRLWQSIVSSLDGTKIVSCVYNGYIYRSTDSGVNWTPLTTAGTKLWKSITSSSDGVKIYANAGVVGMTNDNIYISSDSGSTWSAVSNSLGWECIATSYNGSVIVAVSSASLLTDAQVAISTNYGINWNYYKPDGLSSGAWTACCCDSTGANIYVAKSGGYIYRTTNQGVNWSSLTASGKRDKINCMRGNWVRGISLYFNQFWKQLDNKIYART